MIVRFIAHAGLSIREGDTHILIDPWFTDSNTELPLLEGLTGHKTIDFQVPHGRARVSEYAPANAIFISHFHTHHAHKKDILDVMRLNNSRNFFFGHPVLEAGYQDRLNTLIASTHPTATNQGFVDNGTHTIGPFTIRAYTHTAPGHIAWHIESETGSILHLADPYANEDWRLNTLDPIWKKFEGLGVDVLFLNASGNSFRGKKGDIPYIREQTCFTAAQAAVFTQMVAPRTVSLIGCYNKSVWNGTYEYIRPAAVIEDEFYWASQWVAPQVKCVFAKPRHTYIIGETPTEACDTFLP